MFKWLRKTRARIGRSIQAGLKSWGRSFNFFGSLVRTGSIASAKAIYDARYWCEKYDENSYLQSPVSTVTESFAKVKWSLRRRVAAEYGYRWEEVLFHPALYLFERPNPSMTGFDFRELAMRYLELTGRCLIWLWFDDEGYPIMMWLIEPFRIERIPGRNQKTYVFTDAEGERHEMDPSQVLYFRYHSGADAYGFGCGKATAVTKEVTMVDKANDWSLARYANGANPGLIVDVPELDQESLDDLREYYKKNHTGVENADKTLFLSSSGGKAGGRGLGASVHRMGHSHKELDWSQSKQHLKDDIRENWKVPPELNGDSKNSNRATIQGAETLHATGNTLPRCERWAGWMNVFYLPLFGEPDLRFFFENPVKEDAAFRHKALIEGAKHGLAFADEWRDDRGLDPLPNNLGERLQIPLNMRWVDPEAATELIEGEIVAEPAEEDPAEKAFVLASSALERLEDLKQ